MLFQVSWSIPNNNRVQCWNAFGNMTPDDDLKDAGENIKIVGRWHHLGGTGGVCIAECTDASELNSWMLNWAPICEISVVPVVDDASSRKSIQSKPCFSKSSQEEQKTEDKQVNTENNSIDESSQTNLDEYNNVSVASSEVSIMDDLKSKEVNNVSTTSSILTDDLDDEMNEELEKTINSFVSNSLRQGSINIPLINNLTTPNENSKSDDEISLTPESPKENTWW